MLLTVHVHEDLAVEDVHALETDTLFAVDVTPGVPRTVWSGQTASYSPGAALVCLPGNVLYQPARTEAILAIGADGLRELPLLEIPATGALTAVPLILRNGMLVANSGIVEFGGGPDQLSWYLDATGKPIFFPSAP